MSNNIQQGITIDQLAEFVKEQQALGNGSKHILISQDDEGNGYHECFFGFTPTSEFKYSRGIFPTSLTANEIQKDYIILG